MIRQERKHVLSKKTDGVNNLDWLNRPFVDELSVDSSDDLKELNENIERNYNRILADKARDWTFILKEIELKRIKSYSPKRVSPELLSQYSLSSADLKCLALRRRMSVQYLQEYECNGDNRTQVERDSSYFSTIHKIWPILSRSDELWSLMKTSSLNIGNLDTLELIGKSFSITFYFYFSSISAADKDNMIEIAEEDAIKGEKLVPFFISFRDLKFCAQMEGVIVEAATALEVNTWYKQFSPQVFTTSMLSDMNSYLCRHHVAYSFDASIGEQRIYVDGEVDGTIARAGISLRENCDMLISVPEHMKFRNLQVWRSCLCEEAIQETMRIPWNAKNRL